MKNFTLTFMLIFLTSVYLIAGEWIEKANIPGASRHHPVTWGIGDYGYVVAGSNASGTELKDFYRYDPQSDSWEQLPDFPGDARGYSIGAVYDGIGYIGFGSTPTAYLDDLWSYNPATETWTELATCPCSGRAHPAFIAHEGKIYVGFGNNSFNLNDWWVYDINLDSWEEMPDVPGPPRHHPFHFAVGDYVYAGMGHGSGGIIIYGDWYRFNPDPDSLNWTQMSDFPGEERVAGTQFSLGNYGYVLSGDGSDHSYLETGEFWQYDPADDAWTQLPPHPGESRWAPNSFVVHDTVYFTSGVNKFLNNSIYNDLWAFDLSEFVEDSVISFVNETGLNADLTLYPNPVQDVLYLDIKEIETELKSVSIYDIKGRLITEKPFSQSINVQYLQSGFYFLEIKNSDGLRYTQRFYRNE